MSHHLAPIPHTLVFQWERLHMTKGERRKIFCSVMFHLIAIVCMLWSVYILVKRTAEEIRLGKNGKWFLRPLLLSQTRHADSFMIHGNVMVPWGVYRVKVFESSVSILMYGIKILRAFSTSNIWKPHCFFCIDVFIENREIIEYIHTLGAYFLFHTF